MNFDELMMSLDGCPEESLVFVGLGNPARGDDGAGLYWVQNLERCGHFRKSHFIQAGTNPENFLEHIIGLRPVTVVFADAVNMNLNPGSIVWLDPADLDSRRISTHAFSIKLIQDYIGLQVNARFYYLGIQPFSMKPGEGISSRVRKGLDEFFSSIGS
jgi:hydrogenase maturation protease